MLGLPPLSTSIPLSWPGRVLPAAAVRGPPAWGLTHLFLSRSGSGDGRIVASSHLLTCPLLLLAEKSGTASLLGLDVNKDRPLLPSSGLKNMKLQSLPPVKMSWIQRKTGRGRLSKIPELSCSADLEAVMKAKHHPNSGNYGN